MVKKDIVKKEVTSMEPATWVALKEQAQMLVKSGFLPVAINTPEKAVAVALAGRELGIGTMESFRSINIIQGKPTISPQLMLALANRTGELEGQEIDSTDKRALVTITRKGRKPHVAEFGVKEATDLGLMGKDNYKKQAKTMFVWRALAANLRVTFPDVLLGLYTPEELGAEVRVSDTESMEVVEAKEVEAKHSPTLLNRGQQEDLFKLIAKHHVDLGEFKKHVVEAYGVEKTSDIRDEDYAKLTEWVIQNGKEVVTTK